MDSLQNKTLPPYRQERNEKICENSRRVISVPIILKPIVVPVPLTIVPVQVQDITVTVRVPKKHIEYHLFHHLLNTLKVVYYL
jgi:hypothetical protein